MSTPETWLDMRGTKSAKRVNRRAFYDDDTIQIGFLAVKPFCLAGGSSARC